MTLAVILEDGSIVENANSYVSVEYVTAYAERLIGSTWADNSALHIRAVINATTFIDQKYSSKFYGTKADADQSLEWPRTTYTTCQGITVTTGTMPKALKDATAQAAIQFIEDSGLDLNADVDNAIKSSSVSIGSGAVSESVSYFYPKQSNSYVVVDGFINPILKQTGISGNQIKTSRG